MEILKTQNTLGKSKINTVEAQLEKFIADAEGKPLTFTVVRWLEDPYIKVYVRRSTRFFESEWLTMLDLSNIEATYPGTGRFTQFLHTVEEMKPYQGLFIESVLNKRFAKFWARRPGYTRRDAVDPLQIDFYRRW